MNYGVYVICAELCERTIQSGLNMQGNTRINQNRLLYLVGVKGGRSRKTSFEARSLLAGKPCPLGGR
jgi:hypothetical protein